MIDENFVTLMGERGGVLVDSGVGQVNGDFYGIYCVKDCQISDLAANIENSSVIVSTNITQGIFIPCVVNSITVSSGIVYLLKR